MSAAVLLVPMVAAAWITTALEALGRRADRILADAAGPRMDRWER